MSDRYCIHLNVSVHLSAEDLLACCENCGSGYESYNTSVKLLMLHSLNSGMPLKFLVVDMYF